MYIYFVWKKIKNKKNIRKICIFWATKMVHTKNLMAAYPWKIKTRGPVGGGGAPPPSSPCGRPWIATDKTQNICYKYLKLEQMEERLHAIWKQIFSVRNGNDRLMNMFMEHENSLYVKK